MKRNYGYDTYRGRSGFRTFLKVLAAALVIVLVVVVAGALWITERYGVYSADGVRLMLPWLDREPEPVSSVEVLPVVPSQPIVVVTPEVTVPADLQCVSLPREALYDGSAAGAVAAAGANGALFDMKADDGSLGYVSSLDLAIKAKVSADDPALNAAIRALNDTEGMYTVARVSCFKDDKLSDAEKALNILTNSGYRWTDPEGLHWSSPTSESVRDYLTSVCLELAGLGFDEIVLDNAGYPTQGNLGYIKKGAAYDPDALDGVVTGFYQQVREALDGQYPDVKLSIVTTQAALDGTDVLSGQTAGAVAGSADRVWMKEAETAGAARLLAAAGMEDAGDKLVPLLDAPGPADGSWAVWNW